MIPLCSVVSFEDSHWGDNTSMWRSYISSKYDSRKNDTVPSGAGNKFIVIDYSRQLFILALDVMGKFKFILDIRNQVVKSENEEMILSSLEELNIIMVILKKDPRKILVNYQV